MPVIFKKETKFTNKCYKENKVLDREKLVCRGGERGFNRVAGQDPEEVG